MFESMDISSSALLAQRTRLDTIAGNIANMNTTRDASGKPNPYRRRFALFAEGQQGDASQSGVHVTQIKQDQSAFRKEFKGVGYPDADKNGYVLYPNIDIATEYVDALECSRAYEANVTTMEVTKSMFNSSLRILA